MYFACTGMCYLYGAQFGKDLVKISIYYFSILYFDLNFLIRFVAQLLLKNVNFYEI